MVTVLSFLLACVGMQSIPDTTALRVMTFNVRYDEPTDGEHGWKHRKARVARLMQRADIIGVQEALGEQVRDLESMLPEFAWYGWGGMTGCRRANLCRCFISQNPV